MRLFINGPQSICILLCTWVSHQLQRVELIQHLDNYQPSAKLSLSAQEIHIYTSILWFRSSLISRSRPCDFPLTRELPGHRRQLPSLATTQLSAYSQSLYAFHRTSVLLLLSKLHFNLLHSPIYPAADYLNFIACTIFCGLHSRTLRRLFAVWVRFPIPPSMIAPF